MTVVTSFVPVVREDCGDVFWSHPAFTGGFGVPNGYLVYVNGGPAQAYEPGSEIQVAEDGAAWNVTLKATYEGMSFEHQLGQHKGQADVCVVVPAQPETVFAWEAGEPVTDCDTGEVTTTSTELSAGYWLDEGANEWLLGDWFPTGNTSVEVTPAESCPVIPVEEAPVEEPVVEEPVVAVDDFPSWPETGEPAQIIPAVEVTEAVTEIPVPTSRPDELAVTGGDMLAPVLLAAVAVTAGIALLTRRIKRA